MTRAKPKGTMVRISKETRTRLRQQMGIGVTYDDVISKLLDVRAEHLECPDRSERDGRD